MHDVILSRLLKNIWNFLKLKRVWIPILSVLLSPFVLFLAIYFLDYFYEYIPTIDAYSTTDAFWTEHLRSTEKGFNIKALDNEYYDSMDEVIRIYKLPSFTAEHLIEMRRNKDSTLILAFTPVKKTIWEDRQKVYYDDSGKITGGYVLDGSDYKPSVEIKVDTLKTTSYAKLYIDKIASYDLCDMKSIKRRYILGMDVMWCDGTTLILDIKRGGCKNTFEMFEQKYGDKRYNQIIQGFDEAFTNLR